MYESTHVTLTSLVADLVERTPRVRTAIRAAAGQSGTPYPIEVTEGDAAPTLVGEPWHYRTRGGRRIHHPSSYSRRGWSNMVYSPSSRAIAVGRDWVARRAIPAPRADVGAGI